jgi:hypothetical protein
MWRLISLFIISFFLIFSISYSAQVRSGGGSSGGGSGAVSSVSNSDGTLTISPTTGSVVGSIALAHANTWTGQQVFNTSNVGIGSATPGQKLDVQGSVRATGFIGDGSLLTNLPSQSISPITLSGSNVGIGSATPGQVLDIQGNVRILPAGSTLSIGTTNNTNYLNVGTTAQFNVSSTGSVNAGAVTSTGAFQGTAFKASASGDFYGATGVTSANAFSVFTGSGSTTGFTEIRTTTGVGTGTDYAKFTGTNNGGTEIARFMGNGNIGIGTVTPGQKLDIQGSVLIRLGNTLSIGSGSNGCQGQATLSSGTVTVSTTCTPSSSQGIFLQDSTTGSLVNVGVPTVGTIVAATSFVINSSNALDASNVNWWILKSS